MADTGASALGGSEGVGGGGFSPDARTTVYIWLTAFFVACLLVADVVGIKLFEVKIFGFTVQHTCGMLTFPLTFMLTDLLNDYYGKRAARRVTYIGFTMALVVFVVINIALSMPYLPAPYNIAPDHFDAVFANARVMYVASLGAFLAGSLLDIAIFGVMKRWTGGRMIWLRATGSTVISQVFDSLIVSYLAFGLGRQLFPSGSPPAPLADILKIAATGYTLKFVLAVAITPLIYLGHSVLRGWMGMTPLPPEGSR
jgi:hypothetical protein